MARQKAPESTAPETQSPETQAQAANETQPIETPEVQAQTADTTEQTPSDDVDTKDDAETPPDASPDIKDDEETPPDTQEPEQKPLVVPTKKSQYVSFFEQYIEFIGNKRPDFAIKALNNCIKTMIAANTQDAINDVFGLFKKNKETLNPNIVLQSVAILPSTDRAVVEIITTVFSIIIDGKKSEKAINLDMVRKIVKSETFINWCVKKQTK